MESSLTIFLLGALSIPSLNGGKIEIFSPKSMVVLVGDRAGLAALLYFSENKLPSKIYVDRGYSGPEMRAEGGSIWNRDY